jgi:3-mercaptopyruvate sulfurtransferase SseA
MKKTLLCLGLALALATGASAGDGVAVISGDQTLYLLENGAAFIDNRPQHKFAQGHIPGAVNLPYFTPNHDTNRMTKENLTTALSGKGVAVFYCSGALRAYHAVRQAQEWGISIPLYWYKNGWAEWQMLSFREAPDTAPTPLTMQK